MLAATLRDEFGENDVEPASWDAGRAYAIFPALPCASGPEGDERDPVLRQDSSIATSPELLPSSVGIYQCMSSLKSEASNGSLHAFFYLFAASMAGGPGDQRQA